MPLYPKTEPVDIKKVRDMKRGDSCNKSLVVLSNHAGTHIEAPAHFWDSGKNISDYSIEDLVFKDPVIVDCPKGAGEIIGIDDLKGISAKKPADALLLRTGFFKFRDKDSKSYCYENPSLSTEAARWIREELPCLRAVGIDAISISCVERRDMGREAHRILLGSDGFRGKPVLIIEDLDLSGAPEGLDELIVSPLFIEGVDSAPCTVIGVAHD